MSQVPENTLVIQTDTKTQDGIKYKVMFTEEMPVIYELNDKEFFEGDCLFYDFGACLGNTTIPLLSKYGGKHILYEPNPRMVRLIKRRFKKDNVEVHDKALYGEITKLPFYIGNWVTASSLDKSHRGLGNLVIEVDTTTLDEELKNVDRVNFVKINIEGSEIDVIKNTSKETLEKIDQISMQYHLHSELQDYKKEDVNLVRDILKDLFIEFSVGNDYVYINKRLI